MKNITVNIDRVLNFIDQNAIDNLQTKLRDHYKALINKTGKGNDFLGWVNLPSSFSNNDLSMIMQEAARIQKIADLVVVIGIGGSYLGARAVIDALTDPFADFKDIRSPQIIYAGNHLSEDYHARLLKLLDKRDYAVVVISKSGTTTEPAIAFRLIRNHLEKKYGKDKAGERIIAVTDKARGALKNMANNEGYTCFEIPDDVGGRFSVLTPVGLIPVAIAGFDIVQLINGAKQAEADLLISYDLKHNPVALYAITRNALYSNGYKTEILANFEPSLQYITEWWKQLYGESEGKEHKGIFPAGVNFTTDLHSMGQYIQDGLRNVFETVLSVGECSEHLDIPGDNDNLDGLNFIAGKRLSEVNKMAELGTLLAHVDGGVPNIQIKLSKLNEECLGELIYFFEFACGLSGYLLGVNPFDQPGVEAYKHNMFALLEKPGFEKQTLLMKEKLAFKKE